MRNLIAVLALGAVACGAPVETEHDSTPDVDNPDATGEAAAELTPTESAEPPDPTCLWFSAAAVERYPGVKQATHDAAARWYRWYPEGGSGDGCIRIVLDDAPPVARKENRRILLNPNGPLVEGPNCDGDHMLLIDAITHELGHHFLGDEHATCEGCAMRAVHKWCKPVVPTEAEIIAANGCSDWGPPAVADCPL